MPLISRSYCVNSLLLSKIRYRMAAIDLRVGDINKMTSAVKSWMYQRHLVKPQESLLYREAKEGRLGLLNISARARANLLISFCQSVLGYKCPINQFHHDIFRFFVLKVKIKNPGRLPCFNEEFFRTINVDVDEGV